MERYHPSLHTQSSSREPGTAKTWDKAKQQPKQTPVARGYKPRMNVKLKEASEEETDRSKDSKRPGGADQPKLKDLQPEGTER